MKITNKDKRKPTNEQRMKQTVMSRNFKSNSNNNEEKKNQLARKKATADLIDQSPSFKKHLQMSKINFNSENNEKLQDEIDVDAAPQPVQNSTVKVTPFSLNLSRNVPSSGRPVLSPYISTKKKPVSTSVMGNLEEAIGNLVLVPSSMNSKKFISCYLPGMNNFKNEHPKELKQMLMEVKKFDKAAVPFISSNDHAWQFMERCLRRKENVNPLSSRDINIEWINKNAKLINPGTCIPLLMTCITDNLQEGNYVKLRDESGMILANLSDEMITLFKEQIVPGTCIGLRKIPYELMVATPILKIGLDSVLCITSRHDFHKVPVATEGRMVVIHGKNLAGVTALVLQGIVFDDFKKETQDLLAMTNASSRPVHDIKDEALNDDNDDICNLVASMASQKISDPQFKTSTSSTVIHLEAMRVQNNVQQPEPPTNTLQPPSWINKKNDLCPSANAFKVPPSPPRKRQKCTLVHDKPNPPAKFTGFTQDDGNDDLILQAGLHHDKNTKIN